MIRAIDVLQTAEKIMRGSQLIQVGPESTYLMPGTYCTADIPGSGRRVYKILRFENEGLCRVKNVYTKKQYLIPREFLSAIMTDNAYDYDHIKTFLASNDNGKDSPELDNLAVDQIGVKKPQGKDTGVDITGEGGNTNDKSYAKSRYDKSGQMTPIAQIRNLNGPNGR